MALDKKDLKLITEIVEKSADRLETRILERVDYKIDTAIINSENRLATKIDMAVNTLSRKIEKEIGDLIETDRFIIDKLGSHEYRICRTEIKLGIKPPTV